MSVYEMAKKYYPFLWSLERINTLYKKGKLTEEEYNNIVNENNINS